MDIERLLESEYSTRFDEIRKRMMQTSFGPVKENYKTVGGLRAIPSLKAKLEEYERTGNTENLADVANFAMIEFMYPQHPNGHYEATDGSVVGKRTTVGISVNEMKDYDEDRAEWWIK